MKENKKIKISIIKMIIIMLLFFFLPIIIKYILAGVSQINNLQKLIITIISNLVFIIIINIFYFKELKEDFNLFLKNKSKFLNITLFNWFIALLISFILNLLLSKMGLGLSENEIAIRNTFKNNFHFAFFNTVFLSPYIEEIVFRKSLYDSIYNKNIYLIIATVLFALLHVLGGGSVQEYLYLGSYLILSYSFAKSLKETQNIYGNILVHSLHNFLAFLLIWGVK